MLDYFLPFYPPNNPENQNFEKMKKVCGHIIILHMCTINENHMMYGSWHMENNRQNFSHFRQFFAFLQPPPPPPPPNNPENQNFEKKKKKAPGDIVILQRCTKNHDHIYIVPEIWCMMDIIVLFHFGLIFCPFTPTNSLNNQNFNKMKKHLEISSFYTITTKIMIR